MSGFILGGTVYPLISSDDIPGLDFKLIFFMGFGDLNSAAVAAPVALTGSKTNCAGQVQRSQLPVVAAE